MIDVMYPLGNGSHMDDFELRYSLRSMEANLIDLGDVCIVGHKPEWCTNVIWEPMGDPYKDNKAANIISKIMWFCNFRHDRTFLRASDDQYLLKPIHSDNMRPMYNWDMSKYEKWDHSNKWHSLLIRTMQYLLTKNKTVYNYETHIPMKVEPWDFLHIMLKTDFGSASGYVTNSLYYNSFLHMYNHVKIDPSTRAVFMDAETPFNITDKHQYLCHNDSGLSYDLMNYLKAKFPKPSKYEKT